MSFAEDTQRLRQREIILLGDLERALTPAHDDDGQSNLLAESGVVRRYSVGVTGILVSAFDDFPRKSLRRLRAPQSKPINRLDDVAARVHPLECIGHRQRGNRSVSLARFVDDATNRFAR